MIGMRSLSSGMKEGKDFWGMEIPKEKEGKDVRMISVTWTLL